MPALLSGCASVEAPDPELMRIVDGLSGVDIHSHAGGVHFRSSPEFDLAARMRLGRMTAVCLGHTGDGPAIRRGLDNRIVTSRDPSPGELWRHTQARLDFMDGMLRSQGLRRALQKGDNQTEPPAQGGLTPLGREAIAECNRLGMVVDTAHGTMQFVEQAAKASRTPLVLSHTHVIRQPGPQSRLVSREHARLIAQTGGVVGIWGIANPSASLSDLADRVARAVDAAGVEHVGLGSDVGGAGHNVWSDYASFPGIVRLLRQKGFSAADIGKIAGGNYVRVFNASCLETASPAARAAVSAPG